MATNKSCPGSKIKSGGAGRGLGTGKGNGPLRKQAAKKLRQGKGKQQTYG